MTTNPMPLIAPTQSDRPAVIVGTHRITCLMRSQETGGAYSLFEIATPPHDPGPPPHTHTREDEAFYILQGEIAVVVDGQEIKLKPGAWAFAPRNKPHVFRNDSDTPAKMLMIASPGGLENFFEACGVPSTSQDLPTGPPTPQQIQKILEEIPKYGMIAHLPE